jgi:ubiquitin carboxyl-terminal hydrolase 7
LVAERIPEEEIKAVPGDFINVFHFQGEPNKPHGVPFRFLIKQVNSYYEGL